jgi:DNA (cytosine-5)-methyltransferase 1
VKFGSLFAGIGGIDLGLERAGMECAWQVEKDEWCRRVLAKHWPDVERLEDVREVGKQNLGAVDLIAGGFPCQPHSVAGKRRGAADDRNLWPEFSRIVGETRPRYVIAENVPGIVTTYLDTVLSDLEGHGYACWTFNLPAVAFDAPHRRERIFVVAHAESDLRGASGNDRPEPSDGSSASVADSGGTRLGEQDKVQSDIGWEHNSTPQQAGVNFESEPFANSEDVADASQPGQTNIQGRTAHGVMDRSRGLGRNGSTSREHQGWGIEPAVGRVAHGVPNRVDRLRGLGNAVVPQVAEWIGRRIMEFDCG